MIVLNKPINSFTDVDFTFIRHPLTSNVSLKKNENAIKQAVVNLLTMRPGDKPFHPEISSPVFPYLFETFSLITNVILNDEVKKYVERYEPRVYVTDVQISTNIPNYLNFDITFVIRNTSEPFTVNVLVDRLR